MEKIRYTQRICKDKEKISRFLAERRVGTLGMCDKDGMPYVIPVNYIYWNEKFIFTVWEVVKRIVFLSQIRRYALMFLKNWAQ
jgi:Predicted flavin-nucleotide-binding protein